MSVFRILMVLLLVGALVGCDVARNPPASADMSMRVYDVPPERAVSIRDSLNEAMSLAQDGAVGKASIGADGRLVVLAPDALHASIG